MKFHTIIIIAVVLLGFSLRFIDVSNNPPGLYIDEASIGYNAFSVLKTGKDEYGVPYPLFFESFGDYKVPGYIYAVVASMAVLGKTELAVRLPSILAGTLSILVLYLFLKKLLTFEANKEVRKKMQYLPILSAFLLAISSWHIHFSRGGFEVTVGTFLYLLAWYVYLFVKEKKGVIPTILCILLFIAAVYTYDSFRLLSPMALLFIAYDQKIYKHPRSILYALLTIVLILPIILFSFTPEGNERFRATSSFAQLTNLNLQQKILIFPLNYLSNYFSFYSLDFLFNFGDGNGRHQIPNFGELYRWQIPFLLGGIFILLKQKKSLIKNATFLLLFSAPLAASVSIPSPQTLRSLPLIIPCIILVAIGLLYFIQSLKRFKILVVIVICLVATFEFFLYLHFYYIHYPQVNQLDWGAGYKQMVLKTAEEQPHYKHIVIDKALSYSKLYYQFYAPQVPIAVVGPTWRKPKSWGNESTLYVRPYYGSTSGNNLVANIYLTNINHDIFAQLWDQK